MSATASLEEPSFAANAGSPAPILLVDDNAAKRLAMKSVLSPLGLTIVEADSAVAALRCVMAEDFAVILLDVCMPITDGFQTAALIRRRRQSEWTPIIFVTGYAHAELPDTDHYAEGAVDFIFAPVPPDELRAKVSVFVNLFLRANRLADRALELQESADRLRSLTDAALAANAMQKAFSASASHELRTPTTSILGFTEELLESDSLSERDRGFVDIVYRNAQRLTHLIDDLLVLDQAEIGPSMMHLEPTELTPLIEHVLSSFSAAAQHEGISLTAECAPDPPSAMVDPLRLEQALGNLIGNALKFTPSGGEICVGMRRDDCSVLITVTDTGPGIDPADLDNIFGRFYRTKAAIDSAIKGSGLGLAIAKRMIEAQDGRLSVTSELGRGSTFTVAVPVATCELQLAG